MGIINSLSTAGNMQTYQQDLQTKQQAEALANALNSLKLQQGQNEMTGGGIAGNALLEALSGGGSQASPGGSPMPSPGPSPGLSAGPPVTGVSGPVNLPPPPTPGGLPNMPMPGASPMPQVGASQLQPSGGGQSPAPAATPGPAAPQGASPGGIPTNAQGLTWKNIATAIKKQAPEATGPQVMAAIEKLSPMMTAQNKSDWDAFKLQMQSQLKEQGLQQQLQIANQKNETTQRGQDIRAGTGAGKADPAVIKVLADEVQAGNQSVLTRQPSNIRVQVFKELADREEQGGGSGADLANAATIYHGKQSQASKTGQQLGQLEVAGEGFKAIAPDAIKASNAVPRESWKGAAQLGNWLREQSNDTKFIAFQNFNLGLVREYARAMGGTVAAQNKATDALGTAKSPEAYKTAVKTLQREIDKATQGGKKALQNVNEPYTEDTDDQETPEVGNPDDWSIKVKGQ